MTGTKISTTKAISKEMICFILYCRGFGPWPLGPMDLAVGEWFLPGRQRGEGEERKETGKGGGWEGEGVNVNMDKPRTRYHLGPAPEYLIFPAKPTS